MKKINLAFGLFLLSWTFLSPKVFGQASHFTPLQFLENQGQWPAKILFKGDVPGGYVFLRTQGFSYTLLDQQDMKAMEINHHGGPKEVPYPATGVRSTKFNSVDPGDVVSPNYPAGKMHPATLVRAQTYQVNFLHANSRVVLEADHPTSTRFNFFMGLDSSKWKSGVRSFEGVTYKGMYAHTDLRVFSEASQLKYDLIIYPGGSPKDIAMQYVGTSHLDLKNGILHITTTVGEVQELAPYAYQIIGNQKSLVKCYYRLRDNVVRFKVLGEYNTHYPLIIDPTEVFCSFTGSRVDNWGFSATYDGQGDFYVAGIAFGEGYPILPNPGAFQVNFAGGTIYDGISSGVDISLSKFNPRGTTLLYSTYLGGSSNEQPSSLIVNQQGDLILAGRTKSSDYPLMPVTNSVGPTGGWDIVLSEFSPDGSSLLGSIKIGGSGNDGVNITDDRNQGTTSLLRNYGDDARSEVMLDGTGNIYLASCTQSADFPTTPGVFQPTKGAAQDGVVMKLTPNLSGLVWSSFLGGNENDAAYVVELDKNNDLYVAGATASTDLPTTPGVIQPNYGGSAADGFIAKISNDGSTLQKLTYLGTSSTDEIYGLQLDNQGAVYVTGTTEGVWTVTPNAYYPGIVPTGKQFISKLDPDLTKFIYSTVFGSPPDIPGVNVGAPNISPVAFLVDKCQNVYVTGWGGPIYLGSPHLYYTAGTDGLPVTSDAIKPYTDGRDFYFFVLKRDATSILFASFFGQDGGEVDHVDGGTSRFDPNGVIYEAICANCGGDVPFPTTVGVWSPNNGSIGSTGGSSCNEVALKIAFNLSGVRSGLKSANGDTSGCLPLTLTLE
ncbi:MAG: DUF7948 domain-containing protein, partial [Chitinophagaceae bacterium]